MTLFCLLVYVTNNILGFIGYGLYWTAVVLKYTWMFLDPIGALIALLSDNNFEPPLLKAAKYLLKAVENMTITLDNFCDDGNNQDSSYMPINPNSLYLKLFTDSDYEVSVGSDYRFPSVTKTAKTDLGLLFNCVENQLAQDQECTSFNFSNDWVNGVLYAPLWFRKVRSKKKIFFNLIPIPAKDKWCNGNKVVNNTFNNLSLCQTCAQKRRVGSGTLSMAPLQYDTINGYNPANIIQGSLKESTCYGYKCHKKVVSFIDVNKGLIIPKETMLGENVYYYKSVEYDSINLYSQEEPSNRGDVKMLFATDIVLLGSLNECDIDGVPQFFKNLEGTTYNMPPDLVLMDYYTDEEKIKYQEPVNSTDSRSMLNNMNIGDGGLENIEDEIDDSVGIPSISDVYTDKTGADWGNYGWDQVLTPENGNDYLFPSRRESPDYGGLFYGLTCWSSYTKPKSCINMSRICEFGVSLDENDEYPDYNSKQPNGDYLYKPMPPDGFISYDELYDKDGRAMFATMNGNNLRTKINSKNGFRVYDFAYLYPENFDGSMRNIMNPTNDIPLSYPISENYNVEQNSEAYVRFRYGRNIEDYPIIKFYKSTHDIPGLYPNANKDNLTRFPKYENSFYFYFGLNSGNTAIDKFRKQYYSECRDTDGEQAVVSIEFEANEWCSEIAQDGAPMIGNGWLAIDATYLDAPYDITLLNMSGEPEYDVEIFAVDKPKVLICINDEFAPREMIESGYEIIEGEYGEKYGLMNGVYRLTITDANGYEYSQNINYTKPYINAEIGRKAFRYKNDELEAVVSVLGSPLNTGDTMLDIAQLGGRHSIVQDLWQTMATREIGGFIQVTDVNQEGNTIIDFAIDIEPLFEVNGVVPSILSGDSTLVEAYQNSMMRSLTSYHGSRFELHQQSDTTTIPNIARQDFTLMNQDGGEFEPYCPYTYDFPQYPETPSQTEPNNFQTNGGRYDLRFGVGKGGERYRVTVTLLCPKEVNGETVYYRSRNSIHSDILVPEPIEFKMLVNGIDYQLIKYFETGWNVGYNFPESYEPINGNDMSTVVGWLEFDNIDNLEELAPVTSIEDYTYIRNTNLLLAYSKSLKECSS